jgi:hypothetical protein
MSRKPSYPIRTNSKLGKDDEDEDLASRKVVSPQKMRLRRISNRSLDSIEDTNNCERCSGIKETTTKALNLLRSYIENINDRLSHLCLGFDTKFPHDNLKLPIEYLHTITYTELDRLGICSDFNVPFRQLFKTLRLFSDKYDMIMKKQESVGQRGLQTKKEDVKIDNLGLDNQNIQSIMAGFNNAKRVFESNLKELKSSINGGVEPRYVEISEFGNNQDTVLRNEIMRLRKENVSLKVYEYFNHVARGWVSL